MSGFHLTSRARLRADIFSCRKNGVGPRVLGSGSFRTPGRTPHPGGRGPRVPPGDPPPPPHPHPEPPPARGALPGGARQREGGGRPGGAGGDPTRGEPTKTPKRACCPPASGGGCKNGENAPEK